MMQPYCRAKIERGELIEECGRVLSTTGRCDREARHVPAQESAFPTAGLAGLDEVLPARL